MGNQPLIDLRSNIEILCKNAYLGDGYFWKHPECINYKLIYSSITPELLDVKYNICKSIFSSGVKLINTDNVTNRYANAKPIYRLASLVHPIITYYASAPLNFILSTLTLTDLALWYLDDGGAVLRKDSEKLLYRYYICVGNICNTEAKTNYFLNTMANLFNVPVDKIGKVRKNNSAASENNKTWYFPVDIGLIISTEAAKFNVLLRKCPQV